jgi:hypothetical protein
VTVCGSLTVSHNRSEEQLLSVNAAFLDDLIFIGCPRKTMYRTVTEFVQYYKAVLAVNSTNHAIFILKDSITSHTVRYLYAMPTNYWQDNP